nr:MAG TPA: hypothetical protein [Bacteriophage sp.]
MQIIMDGYISRILLLRMVLIFGLLALMVQQNLEI